jgi:hypothetical protein
VILRVFIPLFLVFGLGLYISACSSYSVKSTQYSMPGFISLNQDLEAHERSLIIAGLNDINGQIDGIENMGIQIGGIPLIKSYLDILRRLYPNQVLTLSAGNLFAIPQDLSSANSFSTVLREINFDGVGMSHSDFEIYRQHNQVNLPLINSNIFEIRSSNLFQLNSTAPHRLIQRGGLNIGVVSVASPRKDAVYSGFYFEDLAASYLRARTFMRRNQADIIILILNADSGCAKRSLADELDCHAEGQLAQFVDRLPPNAVDVILTTGEFYGYGVYNDILVLNSPGNGLYLNTLFLTYDTKDKRIIFDKTILHQPTLLCESFFQLTKDCYLGDSRRLNEIHKDKQKTQQALFLGEPVAPRDR